MGEVRSASIVWYNSYGSDQETTIMVAPVNQKIPRRSFYPLLHFRSWFSFGPQAIFSRTARNPREAGNSPEHISGFNYRTGAADTRCTKAVANNVLVKVETHSHFLFCLMTRQGRDVRADTASGGFPAGNHTTASKQKPLKRKS